MSALQVQELSKTYKATKIPALNQLNLQVEESELYGLIGPDGAGKSSLFRIISTLILPDSGTAHVFNYDIIQDYKKIRLITGYMPGRFSLYMDLSILENLEFFATIFGTTIDENYELIKDIYQQIEPFKHRRASQLSGGMKQKLALCCTLIHRPKILLLDEPTTGVDPISRKEFWEILKSLKSQGMTILVSTPYMDEAALCDRISFISNGQILESDTPSNLLKSIDKTIYAIRCKEMYPLFVFLKNHPLVDQCYTFGDTHHLCLKEEHYATDFKKSCEKEIFSELEIRTSAPDLEDCFILKMNKTS